MSFNLLLDSSLAKQQKNTHNQKSHDFRIYFNPPIELDREKNYQAALSRLITMSYSWYNLQNVMETTKSRGERRQEAGKL